MSAGKGGGRGRAAGGDGGESQEGEQEKAAGKRSQAKARKRVAKDRRVERHLSLIRKAVTQLDKEGASPFAEIGHPKKRAFLAAYSLLASKVRAAEVAGISIQLIYTPNWLKDQQFQDAVERARVMAADVLQDEATRRAVEGVEEPAGWYKGEPGGYVRRYSDNLLMFRLRGELPQKYAERLELRGGLATLNMDALPDELLERIARGEHPMSVLASAVERGISPAKLGLTPGQGE